MEVKIKQANNNGKGLLFRGKVKEVVDTDKMKKIEEVKENFFGD